MSARAARSWERAARLRVRGAGGRARGLYSLVVTFCRLVLLVIAGSTAVGCAEEAPVDHCGECERITTVRFGFEAGEACVIGCDLLDCRTGAMTLAFCDDGGAAPDAGAPDAGPSDGGAAPLPSLGDACESDADCMTANEVCVGPDFREGSGLGGADDPIEGHPGGESTFVPAPYFVGGYCTYSYPEEGVTRRRCNVRDPAQAESVCGFGKCVDLFGLGADSSEDFVPGFCAERCEPSLRANDCRDQYECRLVDEVCLPGCQSDDECRIAREETNDIGGIQTSADCARDEAACTPGDCDSASPVDPGACADPASNFDALVYDTESAATCDPVTFRCVGAPSTPSAAGGDPCTRRSDCEPEGFCLTEVADGTWAGGSCTKWRCDLDGNECANGGVCQRVGVGIYGCFEGCSVGGVDPGAGPAAWVAEGSARSTCREGYGCFWGGEGGAGVADNGVCLPVDYSPESTVPNVGDPCMSDAECYSPFGQGLCLRTDGFDAGYCSVRNCAAPWFTREGNVCGDGAECVVFDPADPSYALCVQRCASAAECGAGLGCVELAAGTRACWTGCGGDADCRGAERCENPGEPDSACVPE